MSPRFPPVLRGTSEICANLEAIGIRVDYAYVLRHCRTGSLVSQKVGNLVAVKAHDLKAWVYTLTGRTFEEWVRCWIDRGRPAALWTPGEAARNPVVGYADGLVTLLEPDAVIGESLVRLPSGAAFVTLDMASAAGWPKGLRSGPNRAARWRAPRMARITDLGEPSGEPGALSTCFVTVLLMRDALLRFVAVPSSLFGSPTRTSTLASAPIQHLRWPEIREYVAVHHPDAIWVAWTEREELDLETMRPPHETIGAHAETTPPEPEAPDA